MQIKKVTFCNVQSIFKGFDSGLLGKTVINHLVLQSLDYLETHFERTGKFDKWKRKLKKKKK